jgi:hypothetical protein
LGGERGERRPGAINGRRIEGYSSLLSDEEDLISLAGRNLSTSPRGAVASALAQRVLVDVAEREARHEWLHGETIAVHIVDVGV